MRVTITARHCELDDSLRARAEELMEKMIRFDPNISHGEVVFEAERNVKRVEGMLSLDRSEPIVAKAEDDEFRPALEQMVDRLARQLRKRRAQKKDHQATSRAEAQARAFD